MTALATMPGGDGAPPRRWRVSILVTLSAGIAALVAVAVITVMTISWTATARSTISLLTDKSDLILALAEARLRDHLDPVHDQLAYLTRRFEQGDVDIDDPTLWAWLAGSLAATPQVVGLAYLNVQGLALGVGHFDGRLVPLEPQPAQQSQLNGALTEAESATGPFWGELIYIEERGVPGLTVRAPIRREGDFQGMLIATVTIDEVSRFISTLEDQDAGHTPFILYGRNRVLAHPKLVDGFPTLTDGALLPGLSEVGDPILPSIATGEPVEQLDRDGISAVIVMTEDDEQIVLTRTIDGYSGEAMTLGVRMPVEAVNSELERLAHAAVAGVMVLVLSVVVSVVMGLKIARPVRRLAERAAKVVGTEHLGSLPDLPGSRFVELDDQARSFNRMLAGLRWLQAYVPRTLVRQLIAHGSETTLVSVERELTVLFTDIAGFTHQSEALPACNVAEFLNDHFALLGSCIEAEGGTIDKFIGDAIMAFWGAPDEQSDHARRAVSAGLAMAATVRKDNRDRVAAGQPPIRLRIGIHTGSVVVGNIGAPGRMNYTIVGDAVNTGNRIEEMGRELIRPAPDVIILISAATAARLDGTVPLEPMGAHPVRGRNDTVEVFRVIDRDGESTAVEDDAAAAAAGV